ncbi:MAG: hypothetical protein ACQES9_11890 [Myxococcota bacterium]
MSPEYIAHEVLLVAQKNELSQELKKMLEAKKFHVTLTTDIRNILNLMENKFFIINLFELDTPKEHIGLKLLKKAQELSPLTQNFILSTHQDFPAAIKGFRMGCQDFILYQRKRFPYIINQVVKSATETSYQDQRNHLVKDMAKFQKEFLKRTLGIYVQLMNAEDENQYNGQIPLNELPPCNILVVDSDQQFNQQLEENLPSEDGWQIKHLTWGSEALDYGINNDFQFAFIANNLPDLPGSMVSSTLGADKNRKVFVFKYSQEKGIFLELKTEKQTREITNSNELFELIGNMRRQKAAKIREKHHMASFRAKHFDFLQKYQDIQKKVDELMDFKEKQSKDE